MKNNNLFLKIYVLFVVILIVSIIVLSLLAKKERVGYLSDFKLNIDKTLEINGLDVNEIKQLFTIDNELDKTSFINFAFTNRSITNYIYNFRIKYYSKIFRNSDIYNVYINIGTTINDNPFIKQIKISELGSPFGNIISSKIIEEGKIDNIIYRLSIKKNIILLFILIIILNIIIICFIFRKNIIQLLLNDNLNYIRNKILLIYLSILIIIISVFVLININIKNNKYINKLYDYDLIEYSDIGYVYKIKLSEYINNNIFYEIDENSIEIANTNGIKNYGYSIFITNKPIGNKENVFYSSNNTFILSNLNDRVNVYYDIIVPTEYGDKYKVTIYTKQLPNHHFDRYDYVVWNFTHHHAMMYITNISVSNDYKILTDTRDILTKGNTLKLSFFFQKGITEVESIVIENKNNKPSIVDNNNIIITLENMNIYNIDNIKYKLKIKKEIFIWLIIIILFPILIFFYLKNYLLISSKEKDSFIILTVFVSLVLFIFHLWIFFPGFLYDWDWNAVRARVFYNQSVSNSNPFLYQLVTSLLFKIFGVHSYYHFIYMLICYYSSFVLIIIGLYLKFRKKYFIFIYIIPFIISDLFYYPIFPSKDFIFSDSIFLLYSLIFFQTVFTINKKYIKIFLIVFTFILFIITLLLRHNAIVLLYPILLILPYKIIKFNNMKTYILKFVSLMILLAFICICIVKYTPMLFADREILSKGDPSLRNVLIFNIAGISYVLNDNSIINKNWYIDGKNFEDLMSSYSNAYYNSEFDFCELAAFNVLQRDIPRNELKKSFFKTILHHPIGYLKFIRMIGNRLCFNGLSHIHYFSNPTSIEIMEIGPANYNLEVSSSFPLNEQKIVFTEIRKNVYSFLYKTFFLLEIPTIVPISICISIFFISGFLLFFKKLLRYNILFITFCFAFSGFAYAFIVLFFTPSGRHIETRYLTPLFPIALMCIISFLTFIKEMYLFKILNKKYNR